MLKTPALIFLSFHQPGMSGWLTPQQCLLIFSKLFHTAWVSLGGWSITDVPLPSGVCPQLSAARIFAKIEAFILKEDSYPEAWHLSLPKAKFPNDIRAGLDEWRQKDPQITVTIVDTTVMEATEKCRPNQQNVLTTPTLTPH